MNKIFATRLSRLINSGEQKLLLGGLKGLEKESLRISRDGNIAQTPHPLALGSALTHPHITTDYSEALLEFITPPFEDERETLAFLEDIHQFVYDHLTDEILLATSMPCGIRGDSSIPIADYGHSNIGRMKHIYRHGLAYRYGRAMQAIAGVHFNYSVPTAFWPVFQALEQNPAPAETFIADAYFGLIRNLQRYAWLLLYLFGASPAICKSFLRDRKERYHSFSDFDRFTFYEPYATSLRMSDIGYQSRHQASLNISCNSLAEYVDTLTRAINSPYPLYENIGVRVDGEYRQLNSNILQIENEYYSTIRPKQIAQSGEKPTLALKRRGIRYIEMRSLDLGLFDPIGINADTLRFIEALALFALLQESPPNDDAEKAAIKQNVLTTAYQGRAPDCLLQRRQGPVGLREWALELCDGLEPLCEILDDDAPERPYSQSLTRQRAAILEPELTPSARILAEMRESGEPFAIFAQRISEQHESHFRARRSDPDRSLWFRQLAQVSLDQQRELEARDSLPFEVFLETYFAQH